MDIETKRHTPVDESHFVQMIIPAGDSADRHLIDRLSQDFEESVRVVNADDLDCVQVVGEAAAVLKRIILREDYRSICSGYDSGGSIAMLELVDALYCQSKTA